MGNAFLFSLVNTGQGVDAAVVFVVVTQNRAFHDYHILTNITALKKYGEINVRDEKKY